GLGAVRTLGLSFALRPGGHWRRIGAGLNPACACTFGPTPDRACASRAGGAPSCSASTRQPPPGPTVRRPPDEPVERALLGEGGLLHPGVEPALELAPPAAVLGAHLDVGAPALLGQLHLDPGVVATRIRLPAEDRALLLVIDLDLGCVADEGAH